MALFRGRNQKGSLVSLLPASLKLWRARAGQSLIDIMIGLALVSLSIGLAAILVYGGQDMLIDRENTVRANAFAREGLEAAQAILASDWSGTSDGSHGIAFASGTWTFIGTSSVSDVFTRRVVLTALGTDTRVVESVVQWSPAPERPREVVFTTLATNWALVEETGGDTGGGSPSGDWKNPRTLGSVDLGPGNSATDLDVKNKIVYLTAEASDAKKPDFYVVDATNGQSPSIVSSINTGPGLLGVDAAGSYAYVVGKNNTEELQVINIANIFAPEKVASVNLEGNADALAVFYASNYLYLGREAGSSEEFVVIDVSNPTNLSVAGSYEVNANVNDVYISGDRAYLATDLDGAGLMILDITNPASIIALGQSYAADVHSVFAPTPSKVFLGPAQEFQVVDTSFPGAIHTLGIFDPGGAVNDIATRDYLAFIGTSNSNREFQVVDISSSTAPVLHSYFNFSQVATGVDYEDNLVYLSVRSNDALRIITSSP